MPSDQADDDGSQQLRLARAGRPDAQPVRAVTTLGRFLDVQVDHAPVGVHTEGHPQSLACRTRNPTVTGPRQDVIRCWTGPTIPGKKTGADPRFGQRHAVGPAEPFTARYQKPTVEMQAQRIVVVGLADDDDGRRRLADRRFGVRAVDDEHEMGPYPCGRHAIHRDAGVEDHRVTARWVAVVRQPFQPVPVLTSAASDHRTDQDRIRAVRHGKLADHRSHQRPDVIRRARDRDARSSPQRQRDRKIGHCGVGVHEVPERVGGHRVEVGRRRRRWQGDPPAQALCCDAEPDMTEVRVAHGPLPHPRPAGQGPQCARRRVRPGE